MEQHFTLSPVLLGFLLVLFALLRLWKKPKANNSTSNPTPPPGPWRLPTIGNLHQLLGSPPHRVLRDLAKKYGPVMQLQLGEIPAVVISSREAANDVLKTHEFNFVERPPILAAEIVLYNCNDVAFAPYGDYWRQMRKFCTLELFSAKRVKSFRSIREEEVSNFIKTIRSKSGSPINLSKMMLELSIGVTARIISKKCRSHGEFLPILHQVLEAMGNLDIVNVFPTSKLVHMISKTRGRLEKLHQEADEILEKIINEQRSVRKDVTKTDQEDEAENLLDVLLRLQTHEDLGFPLTTKSIKAIILEIFGAGSETSSTLWEWTMSELLKNPRVLKKAQEEVRQIFNHSENVDETNLHNLKFLKLVIKETLRLHPPVVVYTRQSDKACMINGYIIQSKNNVIINAWAIGRDSNYWIEPEKFYPERFLESSIDYKGSDFEFIPFGAGKRMCPGLLFGIATVELPLAQLLYHFDWKLPNGVASEDIDMSESVGGTVKRKHNLEVIPIPYRPLPLTME